MSSGRVYLVGAGPGKLSLMTLSAVELLKTAEVLIYDALVAPELLNLVSDECLKIDVGKRGGKVSTPQSQINQMLVAYCHQGKQVVRLKSGDPMIFGRANEEIEAMIAAQCNYSIIPGLSSAIAAPALAGIPLTDKQVSRHFVVLTGHQPENLDWEAIAKIDTIVILMGGSNLSEIVQQLLKHGRASQELIAIIRDASTWKQKVWLGTLKDIVEKVSNISISPGIIIIGQVIKQRFMSDSLPLTGQTILVTRAASQSSEFTKLLEKQGANVLEMPALEITPPSDWQPLDEAIASLSKFNWLILTSANGVEYFFTRLTTLGHDLRALGSLKIAVVGKKTASTLKKYHLKADFIPPDFVADSLVANFPGSLTQQEILFPRVESGGRDVLVKELTNSGAIVTEVAAYQSQSPQTIDDSTKSALLAKEISIITFGSAKTVGNFKQLVSKLEQDLPYLLENVLIAAIGPQTAQACRQLLGKVDIEAEEYTLEGLTEAIVKFLKG